MSKRVLHPEDIEEDIRYFRSLLVRQFTYLDKIEKRHGFKLTPKERAEYTERTTKQIALLEDAVVIYRLHCGLRVRSVCVTIPEIWLTKVNKLPKQH